MVAVHGPFTPSVRAGVGPVKYIAHDVVQIDTEGTESSFGNNGCVTDDRVGPGSVGTQHLKLKIRRVGNDGSLHGCFLGGRCLFGRCLGCRRIRIRLGIGCSIVAGDGLRGSALGRLCLAAARSLVIAGSLVATGSLIVTGSLIIARSLSAARCSLFCLGGAECRPVIGIILCCQCRTGLSDDEDSGKQGGSSTFHVLMHWKNPPNFYRYHTCPNLSYLREKFQM